MLLLLLVTVISAVLSRPNADVEIAGEHWGGNGTSLLWSDDNHFRLVISNNTVKRGEVVNQFEVSDVDNEENRDVLPLRRRRRLDKLRRYRSPSYDTVHESSAPAVGDFPFRRQWRQRRRMLSPWSANAASALPSGHPLMQASPLYGSVNDYAYYFLDVMVGTPPQRQSVILDTGSSLLGFSCSTCTHCGRHLDAPFNVEVSKTATRYSCHDSMCISRNRCPRDAPPQDSCLYQQVYSEGSSIEGFFFSDLISLDNAKQKMPDLFNSQDPNFQVWSNANPTVRYDYIGCHLKETVLFVSQQANGILGISFPKGGVQPTAMDALFKAPRVNTRVFALCVAEDGGVLTVGGYDSRLHSPSRSVPASSRSGLGWLTGLLQQAAAVSTPNQAQQMPPESSTPPGVVWTHIASDVAYSVKLSSLMLGDQLIASSGFGDVLVDSGTTYSYFPPAIFESISKELGRICKQDPTCVRDKGGDLACWTFVDPADVQGKLAGLPSFFVQFAEGGLLEWKAQSYLFRKTEHVWCSALENNRRRQTILGMSFMKLMNVIVDRDNDQIGFASAACPRNLMAQRDVATTDTLAGGDPKYLPPFSDVPKETDQSSNLSESPSFPLFDVMIPSINYESILKPSSWLANGFDFWRSTPPSNLSPSPSLSS